MSVSESSSSAEGSKWPWIAGAVAATLAGVGIAYYYRGKGKAGGSFASPYNQERSEFLALSPLHALYSSIQDDIDLNGIVLQLGEMADFLEKDPEQWIPVLTSFGGHVQLFKVVGSYDPEFRQLPLTEEDYKSLSQLVRLTAVVGQTHHGREAILNSHHYLNDLYHVLHYYQSEAASLLRLFLSILKDDAIGSSVARVMESVVYYMYIARENHCFETLLEKLNSTASSNEFKKNCIEFLDILAHADQADNVPHILGLLKLANAEEKLEQLLRQEAGENGGLLDRFEVDESSRTMLERTIAKIRETAPDAAASHPTTVDPKNEMTRFAKIVDRTNRFSAGMWVTTPAIFPPQFRRYKPEEQESALQRVRDLSREARFADMIKKRDINREIAAICGGVDREFFKGMLHNSGMFTATKKFIDKALSYDPNLTDDDIHKSGRNFWTCLSMQMLLCNNEVFYQDAIFAYSMLYPYTDDYVDSNDVSPEDKRRFNDKFRHWLAGTQDEPPSNELEKKVYDMVHLMEGHWKREDYPYVYGSLLAIQDAQVHSMRMHSPDVSEEEIFEITFEKGGSSVMADGWLVAGDLTDKQSAFTFNFGVALQILDDIQDVRRDVRDQQETMCTLAFKKKHPEEFERLTRRLLNFLFILIHPERNGIFDKNSEEYSMRLSMVKMCYSIVLKAIAKDCYLFTENFSKEIEWFSPLPFSSMKKVVMIKKLMTLVRKDQI